jgi:hypothetical protein
MSFSKNACVPCGDDQIRAHETGFRNKLKSIPLIESTWSIINENYFKIKDINFVTKLSYALAENTVRATSNLATPLLNKFKDQVEAFDNIACLQLARLELVFPIIKSDAGTIVNQSKEKVQSAIDSLNFLSQYSDYNLKAKTINFASRVLDQGENLIEKNLIYCEPNKFSPNNQHIQSYLSYKQESSDMSDMWSVASRGKMLSQILCSCFQEKITSLLSNSVEQIKLMLFNLCKIVEMYELLKMNLSSKMHDQFNVRFIF